MQVKLPCTTAGLTAAAAVLKTDAKVSITITGESNCTAQPAGPSSSLQVLPASSLQDLASGLSGDLACAQVQLCI
jgi:hypothetical protein